MPDLTTLLMFYLPLGIVGVWRWGTWLVKKAISWFYHADTHEYQATVSVVIPVYNEDPRVFRMALESWRANKPDEIIAIIDYTDENSIKEFKSFQAEFPGAKLIITEKPGKRPALADGVRAAKSEIIALVDSDVVWSDNVLKEALRPFADSAVGGVATRQNVLEPITLAQKIFDIQLDLRFHDDMMPAAVLGDAFTVLSGRTAFYRREAIFPLLDDLVNETFWGKQCIGGDDKRLTYLVEAAGWKARYQHTARVYTPGAPDMATLFKQRTRWARNSWRADLRALWQGWVWKHKFLSFLLIDRTISNFTLLVSLVYFIISLILQLWIPAVILFLWWLFSRSLRISPNLVSHPKNIKLVPVYVWVNFALAIVRIYSLLTLNRQDWLTRGVRRRPISPGLVLARIATFLIVALMALAVYNSRF
ncbi:MAG: glycosyltransferase [Chloroflexi bacterium]|nr:glycosyltransferase [Chloroflexota bacterium]